MRRTSEPRALLPDAHIWIWLMLASSELAEGARGMVNRATAAVRLRIAAISLWEAALLAARDRISLGQPLTQWIEGAVSAPGLSIEPLLPRIAVESCCLPDAFHQDPADRTIVATARVTGATLMTRDRRILDYAARGHLAAIAA